MITTPEFLQRARIDARTLGSWVAAGWLRSRGDGLRLAEIDLARAHLIRDLQRELEINDEGVTIILDLVDQVHGLRWTLRELLSAIHSRSETGHRRVTA